MQLKKQMLMWHQETLGNKSERELEMLTCPFCYIFDGLMQPMCIIG